MRRGYSRTRSPRPARAASPIFDGLDALAVSRVAETLGTRIIQATALALVEMARDDAIDPATLSAGIVKAHLIGAASALQSALNNGVLVGADLTSIARDAADAMVEALATMRAAA